MFRVTLFVDDSCTQQAVREVGGERKYVVLVEVRQCVCVCVCVTESER